LHSFFALTNPIGPESGVSVRTGVAPGTNRFQPFFCFQPWPFWDSSNNQSSLISDNFLITKEEVALLPRKTLGILK
jgi:hypothetical protein